VFSPRSLDVDVVLDLMIHEPDIVLTFATSTVKKSAPAGLPILSGKVDIANVRLEFDPAACQLHCQRVFYRARAQATFFPARSTCLSTTEPGKCWSSPSQRYRGRGAPSVNRKIKVAKPAVASEEPLHAELKSS